MGAYAGGCQAEIGLFCAGVEPGEGHLAACITRQLEREASADAGGEPDPLAGPRLPLARLTLTPQAGAVGPLRRRAPRVRALPRGARRVQDGPGQQREQGPAAGHGLQAGHQAVLPPQAARRRPRSHPGLPAGQAGQGGLAKPSRCAAWLAPVRSGMAAAAGQRAVSQGQVGLQTSVCQQVPSRRSWPLPFPGAALRQVCSAGARRGGGGSQELAAQRAAAQGMRRRRR